ncbi:MAG: hypothetical protein FWF41_07765 [Betaproteobacteria bacterium]|nr:hypothetical protein [Betaproteobacteria bacterium]
MRYSTNLRRQLLIGLAIVAFLTASFVLLSVLRDTFKQTFVSPEWVEMYSAEGLQSQSEALFEDERPAAPAPELPTAQSGHDSGFGHLAQLCSSGFVFIAGASLPFMAVPAHSLSTPVLPPPPTQLARQTNRARAPPVFS